MALHQAVSSNVVRFGGEFELDVGAYELRRAGRRLRLARIPMELLLLLMEQPGQLVTREQIAERVWGKDVFLDVDNGINAVVRRIRRVLRDDPDEPRFIQTVVGRGYRFVATIEEAAPSRNLLVSAEAQGPNRDSLFPHPPGGHETLAPPSAVPELPAQIEDATPPRSHWMVVVSAVTLIAVIGWFGLRRSFDGGGEHINSVAVLPFVNTSGDPDLEYLCDGMTEGVINGLSQRPQIRVMARSTIFHYKGRDSDPRTVGHDLDVRSVLSGTLARHGEELRVEAELVDVRNGSLLWGQQYDRKLSDTATVQQEVVRDLSKKLKLRFRGEDKSNPRKRVTESPEAYDLYLRGRYQWNRFGDENLERATGYFLQAIDKDPNFALAYAGLADAYHELSYSHPPREVMPKAKAAATRALELDDSVAEAHAALGWVKWQYDWDWIGAEKEFRRSIDLSPNYAIAHGMYALYLDSMSRVDEAMAQHRRALELEPLSLIINANAGEALYDTRHYDQAIEQYRKTLEIEANFAPAHDDLAQVFERTGMYWEAVAEWQQSLIAKGELRTAAAIGRAYSKSGYRAALRTWLDSLTIPSNHSYVSPLFIASIYARIGETDHTFEWLAKAYNDRASDLVNLKVDPAFDSVRSDPRYAELERAIGVAR